MPTPSPFQRFIMSLSTSSISEEAATAMLIALRAEGALTPRIIASAHAYGVEHLLPPATQAPRASAKHTTLPASQLFNYLRADDATYCLHTYGYVQGAYVQLHITLRDSLHVPSAACIPLSFAQAYRIATRTLIKSAFGVVINDYAIRELELREDGSCYAVNYESATRIALRLDGDA